MMQDGQGNPIAAFHQGDGATIKTVYQGDGTLLWQAFDPIVIDDFSSGDLTAYSGDLDEFDVVSDPVFQGDFSLELTNLDGNDPYISSTDGLNAYPQQGDVFEARFKFRSDSDLDQLSYFYAVQEESATRTGYYTRIRDDADEIEFLRADNGSLTSLASSSTDVPKDEWLRLETEWLADGTHNVTLYDESSMELSSLSVNDDTYVSGGFAWHISRGEGPNHADAAQITSRES